MMTRRQFLKRAYRIGGIAALAGLGLSPKAIADFVRGHGGGTGFDWTSNLVLHLKMDSTQGIAWDEVSGSALMTDANACGVDATDYKQGNQSLDLNAAAIQHLYVADANYPAGAPGKNTGGSQDFLICFWVKIDDKSTTRMFVTKYRPAIGGRGFNVMYDQGTDRFMIWVRAADDSVNLSEQFTQFIPVIGVWHHIGFWHSTVLGKVGLRVWDDTNAIIYNQSWIWTQGLFLNYQPFSVGYDRYDTGDGQQPHDGHIDQVLVYKAVDDSAESAITAKIDSVRQGGTP